MAPASIAAPTDLSDLVHQEMERWSIPGLVVGLLLDGRIEAWGFGIASTETLQPVRADTLFQIGSISKIFTTTLIMQLVDEGLLDLDAPVARYLPELRLADEAAQERVTLRQLLTHTAGFFGDRFTDYGLGDDALSRAVATFGELRQITPPGETWAYCNTGFQLAGAVIERILGRGFEQAAHDRIIKPLQLTRSFFFAHQAITYPVAIGHNRYPDKDLELARTYSLPRCMAPAGGIIGTVNDLLRFAACHIQGGRLDGARILSEDSARVMRSEQSRAGGFADAYGVGWALQEIGGTRVVGHGGSTNGFRAQLATVPDQGFAVALLTNGSLGRAANYTIAHWALEHFVGVRPDRPAQVQVSPSDLARLSGRYQRPLNDITVTVAGDRLVLSVVTENIFDGTLTTWPDLCCTPLGDDRFLATDGEFTGETFEFLSDAAGDLRFLRHHGRLSDRVG